METTINERLDSLIKALGFDSLSKFDKTIGVSRNHTKNIVGHRLNKPAFPFLEKILDTFPQVDARWLLTGKGDMFTPDKLRREYVEDLENKLQETTKTVNRYQFALDSAIAIQQQASFNSVSKSLPVNGRIVQLFPVYSLANTATR